MNKEDKELLLKDLCARLPYGVKIYFGGIPKLLTSITIKTGYIEILVEGEYGKAAYCDVASTYNNAEYLQEEITEKCKPYLRLMSSMTEKEFIDLCKYVGCHLNRHTLEPVSLENVSIEYSVKLINWLNKHMFDYRGLIEKGLALVALEGMYNIK